MIFCKDICSGKKWVHFILLLKWASIASRWIRNRFTINRYAHPYLLKKDTQRSITGPAINSEVLTNSRRYIFTINISFLSVPLKYPSKLTGTCERGDKTWIPSQKQERAYSQISHGNNGSLIYVSSQAFLYLLSWGSFGAVVGCFLYEVVFLTFLDLKKILFY